MLNYIARRLLVMIPTLLVVSFLVFVVVELPPGNYLETYVNELKSQGLNVDQQEIDFLRKEYGFDQPFLVRYAKWIGGIIVGDLGYSFYYELPVNMVIKDSMLLSFLLNFFTILFIWIVSFPIAIYAATHQYSWGDYTLSFIGFIGLATPNFLLALVLMYFANEFFGISIGGLMDPKYINEPMSIDKFLSVLEHIWIPVVIIGTSGTAAMIRRIRANLLDEIQKQYVVTAKSKGLSPRKLLFKYPVRMSLNPFIADIGNYIPQVISGSAIVSVVMSLPTTGSMLLKALEKQDIYLAGAFLLFLSFLTLIGTLISDILLAILDPRIRLQGKTGER